MHVANAQCKLLLRLEMIMTYSLSSKQSELAQSDFPQNAYFFCDFDYLSCSAGVIEVELLKLMF